MPRAPPGGVAPRVAPATLVAHVTYWQGHRHGAGGWVAALVIDRDHEAVVQFSTDRRRCPATLVGKLNGARRCG
jgi:hypothetical protein